MNITPTPEVVTEIAARSVYLQQNWLYWNKCYQSSPTQENKLILEKWEVRIEEFLKGLGALEWHSLKDLMFELTIKNDQ